MTLHIYLGIGKCVQLSTAFISSARITISSVRYRNRREKDQHALPKTILLRVHIVRGILQ